MKKTISKLIYIFKIAFIEADVLTYYPQKSRKSKLRILLDFLKIYLKANEISKVYFIRGGDLSNAKWCEYPYRVVRALRDKNYNENSVKEKISVLADKQKFFMACNNAGLRTPVNYGIINRGKVKFKKEPVKGCKIVVKDIRGQKGENVYVVTYAGGNMVDIDGENVAMEKYFDKNTTFVIQEYIIQHKLLTKLNPSCVNTLRVISTYREKEVKIHAVMLKVGGVNNEYDNWHDQGIIIKVDPTSWEIVSKGYYKYSKYDKISNGIVTSLPANNLHLNELELPYVDQIIEMVQRAHKMVSAVQSVGWDIAIGVDGPILIEGNHDWGFLDLIQVFYGYEIIHDVFCIPAGFKKKIICFN